MGAVQARGPPSGARAQPMGAGPLRELVRKDPWSWSPMRFIGGSAHSGARRPLGPGAGAQGARVGAGGRARGPRPWGLAPGARGPGPGARARGPGPGGPASWWGPSQPPPGSGADVAAEWPRSGLSRTPNHGWATHSTQCVSVYKREHLKANLSLNIYGQNQGLLREDGETKQVVSF